MAWAVIQFPGSNCDADALKAVQSVTSVECAFHWHSDPIEPGQYEVIIIPGGFSFGDYLRAGAIAKLSPAMETLNTAIEAGAHVLGICNGFQILIESRMLPGYLTVNQNLKFISRTVKLRIEAEAFPWIKKSDIGSSISTPIAHRFGNFQAPKMDRAELNPVFRYEENPNGSFEDIAGIYRTVGKGSVLGLMPHPERASFSPLRLSDGKLFWRGAAEALR